MEYFILLVLSLSILVFGAVSGRLESSPITPPMFFTLIGFLVSTAGIEVLPEMIQSEAIMIVAELALVVILFTDASRINLSLLRTHHKIPLRLLSIGLPLTIVLGIVVTAFLFPELGIWNAAILAAILAPTDAALGQAVVSLKRVPVLIRQAINVESGLNDGIAVPVILIFLWCAGAEVGGEGSGYWIAFISQQLILGPLIGIAIGWFGGKTITTCRKRGWMTDEFQRLALIALALAAYSIAHYVDGNGFIAAFAAGLTLGNLHRPVVDKLHKFAEAEGQLLSMVVFLLFGAIMLPHAFNHLGEIQGPWILYAILSLTLIRMIPVSISLFGMKLGLWTHVFLGWFGPRGIASTIFALIVLEQSGLPYSETIFCIVVLVVLCSIVLHGLTAWPGSMLYARLIEREDADMMEHSDVPAMPTRFGDSKEDQ